MNFTKSIAYCFSNYVNFNGRASRSECWWFFLFGFILQFIGTVWDAAMGDTSGNGMSGGPYTYSLYNAVNGNLVTSFNSPALTQSFTNLFSGVYYLEVLDDIDKLNLNNRVFIVNEFIENPEEYIAMSDVYLFPSMHEGLGTPILEAQACGVPIVMNQLPGISDKWINTDMAGYAAPLNEEIWKKMIEKALNIEEYKLQNNSKFITNIAGSLVIDYCYFEKFKEVIGK